ncbi:primary-amine oxidase, partial [Galdieria sulphuraria]
MEDVQPRIMFDELVEVERVVKKDPKVQFILKKYYHFDNMDLVIADGWGIGNDGETWEQSRRLVQVFLWCRMNAKDDNLYAHPIEGFTPIVDLNLMEIIYYTLHEKLISPIPRTQYPYTVRQLGEENLRDNLKPLSTCQPKGVSFQVDGHVVEWQNWRLHIGFNVREALVLRDVEFCDQGTYRKVLHRASLAEMLVPYGDPRPPHNRKIAFDVGEYGLGFCCNSLKLGCDCLGVITYFDAVVHDTLGNPVTIKNAICLHEEDSGLLWKHSDIRSGDVEVRRGRKLVISCVATFVNYEYGLYWYSILFLFFPIRQYFTVVPLLFRYFHQDGKIEFTIKHTGQLFTSAWDIDRDGKCPFGTLVAPNVNAQYHQHFYCMRLDFDLDDEDNYVSELNVSSMSEKKARLYLDSNKSCYTFNGIQVEETIFEHEKEAQRRVNPEAARYWKVSTSNRRNRMGYPCSYKIIPQSVSYPFALDHSSIVRRCQFVKNSLWVTPYDELEYYPAGDYPNQSRKDEGLAKWTDFNRNIRDTDIVVWYSFGITHKYSFFGIVPQCEDWPIMPVIEASFAMHPSNFFDQNPTMDVPPQYLINDTVHACQNGH